MNSLSPNMDIDGFNGTEAEYHRLRGEALASNASVTNPEPPQHDGLKRDGESPDIASLKNFKQDVNVELPASCDPPGPNNPPKQLVWIVSLFPQPLVMLVFVSGF